MAATLVARKALKYQGQQFGAGEALSPQPEGRLRQRLVNAGLALVLVDGGGQAGEPTVSAVSSQGFTCGQCEREFKTPGGLAQHTERIHGED